MLVPLPLPLLLPLRSRAMNSASMSRVAALAFGRVLISQQRQCHSSGPVKPPSATTTTTTAAAALNTLQIPVYQARDSESVETKRSRLLYQSRKRGMLENGLVLSTFASRHLAALTANQLNMYDTLINQPSNDWDIYYWVTGAVATPAEYDNEVMAMLKAFVANKDRESRLHQPSLYAE